MNPVLIYTNTSQIAADKSALMTNIELFQNIYDAVKAIGITASVEEISNFVHWTATRSGAANFETEYAVNKLLDAAAPYEINGVQLQRAKVKEMIAVPDMAGVKSALAEVRQISKSVLDVNISLITIVNDVVSAVDNSDTLIENRNTYYTKTDSSTALANSLQVVCDALNDFDGAHNKQIYKRISEKIEGFEYLNGPAILNPHKSTIWGIELKGGRFVVAVSHIRAFEERQPLN